MITFKTGKTDSAKLNTALFCFICVLSFLAALKTVFFSIDIDESYAVAQAYRLVQGDRLFADMWEPHQMSAYFCAFFIKLYLLLFRTTDAVVAALRGAGCVIHFGIGIYLFHSLTPHVSRRTNYLLFFLHANFLPKWIALPEFELMQYWFFLLMALWFLRYYAGPPRKIYLVLCGIMLVLQMMNYPTMILLYPLYAAAMIRCRREHAKQDIALFTGAALLTGLLFLMLLFSYMDYGELVWNLRHIWRDRSHNGEPFGTRMAVYFRDFLTDFLILSLSYGVCLALCFLASGGKKEKKQSSLQEPAILLLIAVFAAIQIGGCLLADQNQFFFQIRYLGAAAAAVLLTVGAEKKRSASASLLSRFLLWPCFGAFFASLLLTNMSANVAYTRLFPCTILCFILLDKDMPDEKKPFLRGAVLMTIMGLLVCRLALIRVTGCFPVTMRAPFAKVSQGPLKGLYIHRDLAAVYEANSTLLKEYTSASDSLFYFGAENILYLCTDAKISVASVQGTAVFDENFLEYLDAHPEKFPTVVAVDHNYPKTPGYSYSRYNDIIADWIAQEYPYEQIIETDSMTLYLRHGG